MKKNRLLILGLFFSIIFASCGSNKVITDKPLQLNPSAVTGQLSNGMSYYILNNKQPSNRIALRLVVKAGSCMEEDDQKGVAHFVEHLAFNGTKNFEKSAIVDFLESIGMNFGADLNAYTSFEETVYMLEIPADNPEYLEKALLILHDWACGLSFDPVEIDKERGVVTEEWRSGRGLRGRVLDNFIPLVMAGSRYENRLPIGDMDIIKNISPERIVDFYKKWYRPEIMSVVIVGDEKTSTIENSVKRIMGSIPKSEETVASPVFNIPYDQQRKIKILKDPEQPYVMAQFIQPEKDYEPVSNELLMKNDMSGFMASQILNDRFSEISMKTNSPWLAAQAFTDSNTNYTEDTNLAFIPKNGLFVDSMKLLIDEIDRFVLYGPTNSEVIRIKNSFLSVIESQYQNKDKVLSTDVAAEFVKYVTSGSISMSEDYAYKIFKKIINAISLEDIYEAGVEKFGNKGSQLFILAPYTNKDIPSESIIMDVWNNYKNQQTLIPYSDNLSNGQLMVRPAIKNKIVSKKAIPEAKATEYILENGVKIITKKTKFKNKEIEFKAVSRGGLSLVDDADYPSGTIASKYAIYSGFSGFDFTQLNKLLSDKKIDYNISIGTVSESISGKTSPDDLETALQLIFGSFVNPQFTEEGWNKVIVNENRFAESFGLEPKDIYNEKIREVLYGKTIRHASKNKAFVQKMNAEAAEKVFRSRFKNVSDFTFVFTGDFDETKLINLCSYYLGNIPGDKEKHEKEKNEVLSLKEGVTSVNVYKGMEEQSHVYMNFNGKLPAAKDKNEYWLDGALLSQFERLIDIRLRENIREDKGGSYGVSVYSGISNDGEENRNFMIEISFGCEPSRTEELKNAVLETIKELQTQEVDLSYIKKINETYRRNRELNLKNNGWWENRLVSYFVYDTYPKDIFTNHTIVTELTTAEKMKELANKYLDLNNYIVVYLKPEK